MSLKLVKSVLFVVAVGLVTFFPAREGVPQGKVIAIYTYFPYDIYDRFVNFGDLKAEEWYEIYYDGYPTMMMQADQSGRLRVPVPPHNYHVEARQYIHAQSAVEMWEAYN